MNLRTYTKYLSTKNIFLMIVYHNLTQKATLLTKILLTGVLPARSLMKNICQLLKAVILRLLKIWLTNRQNEKTAVFDTVEVNDSVGSTAVTPTLTRRNGVYTAVYNSISQPDAKSNSSDENSIRYLPNKKGGAVR